MFAKNASNRKEIKTLNHGNKMKNDNINKRLKDWDEEISLDKNRNPKIKAEIMKNLERPLQCDIFESCDPYFHIHKKVIYFSGIAAGLCFAFLLGTQFSSNNVIRKEIVSTEVNHSAKFAQLSQEEIRNLKKISSEVDRLFPEGVRMISQENDGNLQIDTDERKGLDNKGKVLLRYVVLKQVKGEKIWKNVYTSDVIANVGEPIELKGKGTGHIWIYPADKDIYAVESSLKIKANGETISLDYAGGQEVRTPQNIKIIKNQDSTYKVYQTLVRM